MKIKSSNIWNNLKNKIIKRIQVKNSIQNNNKILLLNKNFINNQNYVLSKKQKMDNIIYFLWYIKIIDSFIKLFLNELSWTVFSIIRKLNFWIKNTLIIFILLYLLLPIIFSLYFTIDIVILFIYLFIWIIVFKDYFKFKNYDSVIYKINTNRKWKRFSRFRRKNYWISNNYIVYNKKKKSDILKYDLFLKNKIKYEWKKSFK